MAANPILMTNAQIYSKVVENCHQNLNGNQCIVRHWSTEWKQNATRLYLPKKFKNFQKNPTFTFAYLFTPAYSSINAPTLATNDTKYPFL